MASDALAGRAALLGAFLPLTFAAASLFFGCSDAAVRFRFFCAEGAVKKDDIVGENADNELFSCLVQSKASRIGGDFLEVLSSQPKKKKVPQNRPR
jgi:hypothetical protein